MEKLSKKVIKEKIALLEEARELIEKAVANIREAVQDTSEDSRAAAYIIPTLEMCCYESTNWLGKQESNIEELINSLEESEDED